ncbi:MAG: Rrf2 family transcriptional regulator [bacterium]|nr:Rrf2 family transcriptional regulator [bacterium]
MLISTRGRYALRIMIDLAEHQTEENYVPLKETASRQEISEKYLEGILKILVKNKLLIGLRGKGGGYRLAKSPEQYTIWSILILTETSLSPVSCLEPGQDVCPRSKGCKTLPMWQGLDKVIRDYLTQITLADLIHSDKLE